MKRRIRLDQIKVASPCPVSWSDMLGDDRVRLCTHCSKKVYNLSALTRNDGEDLVTKKNGKLCALFYVRRDGSIMNADCPIGLAEIRKRIVRRVSSVAAAIFALVGLGNMYMNYRQPVESMSPISRRFENQGLERQVVRKDTGEEIIVTRTMGVVMSKDSFISDD